MYLCTLSRSVASIFDQVGVSSAGTGVRDDPGLCPEKLIFQMRIPYKCERAFSSHLSSLRVKESFKRGAGQVQETVYTDGETRS